MLYNSVFYIIFAAPTSTLPTSLSKQVLRLDPLPGAPLRGCGRSPGGGDAAQQQPRHLAAHALGIIHDISTFSMIMTITINRVTITSVCIIIVVIIIIITIMIIMTLSIYRAGCRWTH